jgi:hypothetical protein
MLDLTIKVGEKKYTILIDEGTSVIGDSYNEVLAKNKKEITKAINESLGIKTEEEKTEPKSSLNASTYNK